jgi:hypothetical protein
MEGRSGEAFPGNGGTVPGLMKEAKKILILPINNKNMSPFVAELTGTAVLITLGSGVVANVLLDKTKGNNSGLIVIALGDCGFCGGLYFSRHQWCPFESCCNHWSGRGG